MVPILPKLSKLFDAVVVVHQSNTNLGPCNHQQQQRIEEVEQSYLQEQGNRPNVHNLHNVAVPIPEEFWALP
jgi:hypothetical protein